MGSIPYESEEEVWTKVFESLPGRCSTAPDGETGSRVYFVRFQKALFPIEIHGQLFPGHDPVPASEYPKDLDHMPSTGYDKAAVKSYQNFRRLRSAGKIPQNIRFQVCIPGIMNTIYSVVAPQHQAAAAKAYEKRLLEDLTRLQEQIPPEDLAVQLDVAVEFALLEKSRGKMEGSKFGQVFTPYWLSQGSEDPFLETKQHLLNMTVRLAEVVKHNVSLGFHLCYGDIEHSHFVQPESTGTMVDFINSVAGELGPRSIDWVHMPVPKDRKDEGYFEPLQNLRMGDAKLYLGLVHAHDQAGTEARIKAAQAVLQKSFGVATECGMGRTPVGDLDSIFEISRALSDPIV